MPTDDPHIDRRLELLAEINDIAISARAIVEELTRLGMPAEHVTLVEAAFKTIDPSANRHTS